MIWHRCKHRGQIPSLTTQILTLTQHSYHPQSHSPLLAPKQGVTSRAVYKQFRLWKDRWSLTPQSIKMNCSYTNRMHKITVENSCSQMRLFMISRLSRTTVNQAKKIPTLIKNQKSQVTRLIWKMTKTLNCKHRIFLRCELLSQLTSHCPPRALTHSKSHESFSSML